MAFKVDGYVDSLLKVGGRDVQEGDFVAKGAVLARVRQSDYRAGLDASRAQALQADEGLNVAMWQLSQVEGDLHKRLRSMLSARRLSTRRKLSPNRTMTPHARNWIPPAHRWRQPGRTWRLSAICWSSAKAQERSSTITFDDTALVAPMAAVVLEKRVEPGTLVGRGTAAFRLGDLSTVRMAFGVPDTASIGTEARRNAPGPRGRVPGQLISGPRPGDRRGSGSLHASLSG